MKQHRRPLHSPIAGRAGHIPLATASPQQARPASTYDLVMSDIRAGRGEPYFAGPGASPATKAKVRMKNERRKYGNIPCKLDGLKFDSKKERNRWMMLGILQRTGAISDLRRQVMVDLVIDGRIIRRMRWDFGYTEQGRPILDDTKGAPATEGWLIKLDFLRALQPDLELRINGVKLP